ncbi:biotin transporter BioY [Psychrobacillus psychrodurans]|uniref:biotin transporter BioY n=1 Tax=Psychrobacillus TaxID=1221880 RepID=UPI003B8A9582
MRNNRLKMMIVAALFAAIIAVAAQIMINMPPVPFTLMTIAVMLTATILGAKYGTLAVSV